LFSASDDTLSAEMSLYLSGDVSLSWDDMVTVDGVILDVAQNHAEIVHISPSADNNEDNDVSMVSY
jgi:hypothetical protein